MVTELSLILLLQYGILTKHPICWHQQLALRSAILLYPDQNERELVQYGYTASIGQENVAELMCHFQVHIPKNLACFFYVTLPHCHVHNPRLVCWGLRDHVEQRWLFPVEAIIDQPNLVTSSWLQMHMWAQPRLKTQSEPSTTSLLRLIN